MQVNVHSKEISRAFWSFRPRTPYSTECVVGGRISKKESAKHCVKLVLIIYIGYNYNALKMVSACVLEYSFLCEYKAQILYTKRNNPPVDVDTDKELILLLR